MKVKNLNASARKTKECIRKAFAELLYEKHELEKITVTELVKKADITRSSFYNHYDSIYDVAKELQDDTMDVLLSDEYPVKSVDDVYNYIDKLTDILKQNEDIYRMLLANNDNVIIFRQIRSVFIKKATDALKDINHSKYLELKVNFFVEGIFSLIIKHYSLNDYYTIDELNLNIKEWFKDLFSE